MKAVILAAGLGTRMGESAAGIPKCLVTVAGRAIIDHMIGRIASAGIESVVVVSGHHSDVLSAHLAASTLSLARSAHVVFNERYADYGNFYTLLVARDAINGESFIKFDADVIFDENVLPTLLAAPGTATLALDTGATLAEEEMKARTDNTGAVVELSKRIPAASARGESIGIERIHASMGPQLFAELEAMVQDGETHEYYERAYERLMRKGVHFDYADVRDCIWAELDDATDLATAEKLAERHGW